MRIIEVKQLQKEIVIEIPLTRPTGKIRIKERSKYTDFGTPVPTRQKKFNQNMYVEWQISYDTEVNSKNIEPPALSNEENLTFISYNGKQKRFYELSEYLYYFYKMGIVDKQKLEKLRNYVNNIKEQNLIENLYKIYKSNPIERNINGLMFLESEIKYPHLIYDFNNGFFIIAEIVIKEKQRAVGIQPMLYLCFPITYLEDKKGNSIIGRKANKNEHAVFRINKDFLPVVENTFKIFGMLSKRHRIDVLAILETLLNCN